MLEVSKWSAVGETASERRDSCGLPMRSGVQNKAHTVVLGLVVYCSGGPQMRHFAAVRELAMLSDFKRRSERKWFVFALKQTELTIRQESDKF